jgi:NADPH:quinone reductase-like Zn-dependent oxidoreductase
MKAVMQDGYCGPEELRLEEVPEPEIADDEVLVKVKAASVNPFDWHVMRGDPAFARLLVGLRRPKVPIRGVDVAGVVEAVGSSVTEFKTALEADDTVGTCTALQDFRNLVKAQTGKKLSAGQAEDLTDAAIHIGEQICFD